MAYLEELLPEFRKGAKIRKKTWDKGIYIYIDKNTGYPQGNGIIYIFQFKDLVIDSWELYQEPEPDWDYIIKNKCLCFFWDDNFKEACVGILGGVYEGLRLKYALRDEKGNQVQCRNCRPVRRDEVTFYEDKRDD